MIILYIFGTWVFMHLLHPFSFPSELIENIASVPIGIAIYFSAIYLNIIPPIKRGDLRFYHFAGSMGSIPNYFAASGRQWTTASNLFRWSKRNKKHLNVNLDNFIFTPPTFKTLPFASLKHFYHNKPINIPIVGSGRSGTDAVEGIIVLGMAGGGKSQFLLNLFEQNKYNRAIVHDVKGEFVKYFYREDKDIILNTYDERGAVWDMFAEAKEHPIVIKTFFEAHIVNFMDKDFWTYSAIIEYKELFFEVLDMPLSSLEKWKIYSDAINDRINTYENSDNKTKMGIAQTMKIIQEHYITQSQQIALGAKLFTIHDFIAESDVRMFLSNREEYKSGLTAFFTAFLSVMISILSGKEDTKTDITLMILDEYLTFANKMEVETLNTLHTRLRSPGVMIVTAMQLLPTNQEKRDLVWGNNRYYIVYPISDQTTKNAMNDLIGKTIYVSKSVSEGEKSSSASYKKEEADTVENTKYSTIDKANYAHITFVSTANKLYIGENNIFEHEEVAKTFIKNDIARNIQKKID